MSKTLHVLSCGIYQPEFEAIFAALKDEFLEKDIVVDFVSPGLHVDNDKLGANIASGLAERKDKNILLLYGSMCHPEIEKLCEGYRVIYPAAPNCIEVLLDPEKKKALDQTGNIFYMTSGWLKFWREIFLQGQGWDPIDARINFGFYDKILILDSGVIRIDEEELFNFFEYTQVPIEIETIDLEYFKNSIIELCRKAF